MSQITKAAGTGINGILDLNRLSVPPRINMFIFLSRCGDDYILREHGGKRSHVEFIKVILVIGRINRSVIHRVSCESNR